MNSLNIKLVDIHQHSSTCVKFRADSFFCSFGTDLPFWDRYGLGGEKYLELLRSSEWLKSYHVWEDGQIIGQIELGLRDASSRCGHVNLYYLIPSKRGAGYGGLLEDFSVRSLQDAGAMKATLTVSPTNKQALRFYEKHGWINLGPHPDEGSSTRSGLSVWCMEKALGSNP